MTKATGNFTVGSWEEAPYDQADGAPDLVRANVAFRYSGDLDAEGASTMLMVYAQSAGYVGYERITGRLDGREGSFVVAIDGNFADSVARTGWRIVGGSGTGALQGITGEGGGESAQDGRPFTWWLDYELPAA
jgi:hypothetical protein